MSSKENLREASMQAKLANVKPEPQELRITPLSHLNASSEQKLPAIVRVKAEIPDTTHTLRDQWHPTSSSIPGAAVGTSTSQRLSELPQKKEDVDMPDATIPGASAYQQSYTTYQSASDVPYIPENALKEGLSMVKSIKANIKKLEIGSKLRHDVWLKEIESLQSQGTPSTMVAVCGPTGAGKSSLLNAILDDTIVPTSGMRACTAVVTEISYHEKNTIEADVSFLKLDEWRQELVVLLADLLDEDGNVKRPTGEAGIAWSKVHAVYPSIDQERLKHMTVDQILAKDPKIASLLGTTKHITARNSAEFAKQIGKYIDSKDQKRGGKKDKSKSKKDLVKFDGTKREGSEEPALWPLISQVKVYSSSKALSSGVVLVDLPGTGDANAARNSIAKQYMKNCDCVWILAPITRAVDDKTARDLMGDAFRTQLMNGNYDTNAITFIATKCDDISCSEVVRALQLEDDPVLEDIETRIDQYHEEMEVWKEKKTEAERGCKLIDKQLKDTRALKQEYEDHLQALKDGESFTPKLTARSTTATKTNGKKRKNSNKSDQRSPKRRKGSGSDEDDSDDDDPIDDSDEDSVMEVSSDLGSEFNTSSDLGPDLSGSDSENEDSPDGAGDQKDVTEESLTAKIEEAKSNIKVGREQLSAFRTQKKEAVDMITNLKKKQAKVQREKNAFCSLKRSEFSRDILKEDFRQGLKDMDDAAAEQINPETFNPSMNIRDYDKIDLPVFTCSSRDYVRLKGQVKGDGEPSCFTQVEDTCIPALQDWCHKITVSSRERSARNFLTHIKTFSNSVRAYIEGFSEVTETDRATLRAKWESFDPNADDGGHYDWFVPDLPDPLMDELYTMQMNTRAPKVDSYGEPIGVTPRLVKDFAKVIQNCVNELQDRFRDGLEEKCQVGATNAAAVAVQVSDEFAASMHWATYRATLRRNGEWRRDLNVELCTPLTKNIASSWSKVFESDLFGSFETSTKAAIKKVVKEVEVTAPLGLKDRTRSQGELCLEEANIALNKTLDLVKDTMNAEQKEVSRVIAPYVQQQLQDGYETSYAERGTGSVARQKKIMRDWIADVKDEIFVGSADTLMERLAGAAQSVGTALNTALEELAEKVEVSLSVLWEENRDDPAQELIRATVVKEMKAIIEQVGYWTAADKMRKVEEA